MPAFLSSRWMRQAPPLPDPRGPSIQSGRALLINPFYPKDPHASFGKHVLTPTLALTSVAAATPPGFEVEIWDENLVRGAAPVEPLPEVVGITVHLTFAQRAYALADRYRAAGCRVVLGGLHVQSCPDEASPHADALALGDGVQLWPRILQDHRAGRLQPRYEAQYLEPYENDPAPARHLLPKGRYLTAASLIATRGCHNRCGFCYLSTKGLKMPYQMRRPEQIAEEFEASGEPYGVFTDNNLGSKPEYLRRLCDALEPLEKIWSAAVSIDIADDPELVRRMALAGCTGVFIGFESLTDENIQGAGKKSPKTDDYARRVALLHRYGIQVNGSFVFGFDHDGPDVFERTVEWVEENRLECATFHLLTPYPGTPLFARLSAEGRILHRDWNLYDTAHVVFRPARMTEEQLFEGYGRAYRKLFSASSIWRRRPDDRRAVLPYLGMSVLYKRSNWLWPLLIKSGMTARVWRPFVERTRRRHLKFRERLRAGEVARAESLISAGV